MERIKKGGWDVLVLQGQKISSSGKYSYSTEAAIELCRAASSSGTRVILFSEWGRLNVDGETERIEQVYASIADAGGASLSPVGQAWQRAQQQRPETNLHAADGNHSNATGAFLAACVLYETITGNSPLRLPPIPESPVDAPTQTWLKQVARETVTAGPASPGEQSQTAQPPIIPEAAWYRGNLHTHSLWSDGDDFPEMITAWFADHGYHFLAMTDHNVLMRGDRWMDVEAIVERGGTGVIDKYRAAFGDSLMQERQMNEVAQVRLTPLDEYRGRFEKAGQFLLLEGEEVSDSVNRLPVHLNAVNLEQLLQPAGGKSVREAIENNFRLLDEQATAIGRRMFMQLNHPNFGWAVTAEDMAAVRLATHFEVFNGHPSVNHRGDGQHPSVERMWDIVNTLRIDKFRYPPLFGLATDDCHYYHGKPGSHPGRGWIMVKARELTADDLMKAIHAGDFYASSGVSLKRIDFDPNAGKLTIEIEGEEGIDFQTQFIGTRRGYDETSEPALDNEGNPLAASRIYSAEIGEVFSTDGSLAPSCTLTGDELYVRAVVTSSKPHPDPVFEGQREQAWTQPFQLLRQHPGDE
jgi:hypothetical protein